MKARGSAEAGRSADASRRACRVSRRGSSTTVRDADARPAPDLVERQLRRRGAEPLWVADITYIPTWAGFLFLAVVLDACSRRSSAGRWPTHLRTELVLAALNMALGQRRPDKSSIIPTRAPSTPRSPSARCREAGVRPSMGSVGDAYDNAMCESFFATLECELLDAAASQTRPRRASRSSSFIEGWYNPIRRHKGLGRIPPIEFEQHHSMNTLRAVTHRPARSGFERSAPRATCG